MSMSNKSKSSATAYDQEAVHKGVPSEIALIGSKAAPTADDILIIEDAADDYNKKRIAIGTMPGAGGGEVHWLDDGFHVEIGEAHSPDVGQGLDGVAGVGKDHAL